MDNKNNPDEEKFNELLFNYGRQDYDKSSKLAKLITEEFPSHQLTWKILGVSLQQLGKLSEAVSANIKAVNLKVNDYEAHNNLGFSYLASGNLKLAEKSFRNAISLNPKYDGAYNNLGIAQKRLGELEKAERSFKKAILLNSGYAQAYKNLSSILHDLGKTEEAFENCRRAIDINPKYINAFWNLSSFAKNIEESRYWIERCLAVDPKHLNAILMNAALLFYQGQKSSFLELKKSKLKDHYFMRSFQWVFDLPYLPKLYFNKWHLLDDVIKQSIFSRPFYEFGVWKGLSFKYLKKYYNKGYGFDVFTGLPEDWKVGNITERSGSYSNEGKIPTIDGGEFIKGKFEDTLPIFFSKKRPLASICNFDADLYSSTLIALTFASAVIDSKTILIFDELIMTESWENDEFRALNEFCIKNNYTYEVIAVSFFTKQVALKLKGF